MGVRGELFSSTVSLANRTYFFNVKENRMGDLYLNIVESKNRDTGGFERQSVVLFADDLQEFLKGFDESLKALEKAVRGKRRPKQHDGGPPRQRSFDEGPKRPRSFEDGPRRPRSFEDGPRRPRSFEDGPRRPRSFEDGPGRPKPYGGGPREAGERRPRSFDGPKAADGKKSYKRNSCEKPATGCGKRVVRKKTDWDR